MVLRRVIPWLGALAGGVVLVGLGAYFVHVGLDRADKLAGVLGAFAGLVGLGLSAYGIVLARRPAWPASGEPQQPAPEQVVSNSSIGGDNVQIGSARDVDIHRGQSG
jgi:hypothetical protein